MLRILLRSWILMDLNKRFWKPSLVKYLILRPAENIYWCWSNIQFLLGEKWGLKFFPTCSGPFQAIRLGLRSVFWKLGLWLVDLASQPIRGLVSNWLMFPKHLHMIRPYTTLMLWSSTTIILLLYRLLVFAFCKSNSCCYVPANSKPF